MIPRIADCILFVVIQVVNISTFLIFVSRVKWPNVTRKLAIVTVLMGIPAGVIVSLNATAEREWFYQVMPSIFIAWTIFVLVADIILKLEFRQPRNLKILVPFLLLFYIGLGGMGVLTWRIGFTFWAMTAVTFALQFGGMAYAHRHGKG
ncbi:MAG: hypothetical protein ACETVW_01335 [Dehalococcoidia bacterium]